MGLFVCPPVCHACAWMARVCRLPCVVSRLSSDDHPPGVGTWNDCSLESTPHRTAELAPLFIPSGTASDSAMWNALSGQVGSPSASAVQRINGRALCQAVGPSHTFDPMKPLSDLLRAGRGDDPLPP